MVAGARIAAEPRLALFDRESAKAAQFNPVAARQRLCDLVENGVDDILDVRGDKDGDYVRKCVERVRI